MARQDDLDRFYGLLDNLEQRVGGTRKLKKCTGYMDWPERGVYFFFEGSEDRPRVTRVGTHAVSEGSKTTLWNRLRNHRGTLGGDHAGGGNHRGSIFRLRVGEAIIEKEGLHEQFPNWGEGSSAAREVRDEAHPLEKRVSGYIRELPMLWLGVDDEPGPDSERAYVERNAIALLSNFGEKEPVNPRSRDWLGTFSPERKIRESGLWNSKHVEEDYDPEFLEEKIRS